MSKSLVQSEYVRELERLEKAKAQLPHLYSWPWYKWARAFYESRNRMNLITAANQISKSSTQIRKTIHWATEQDLWPELWDRKPLQFWYLYPTKDVATIEFKKKWIPEFLPNEDMKDHPKYGWEAEYDKKMIWACHFKSGVSVYFKTYRQDSSHLQSGTVAAVFCDEELPEELYPELRMRLAATRGYFHMVFTATLSQEFWWNAIEEKGTPQEKFKSAFKQQISMYDCMEYEDGTPSQWTKERIEEEIENCGSDNEVKRRIFGRFVKSEGLKYPSFSRTINYKKPPEKEPHPPKDWPIYTAVDYGSGGKTGHPSAIVFIAMKPDFSMGRLFKAWRGDGEETTAGDLVNIYRRMKGDLKPVAQFYDWAAKDFKLIAQRAGESFIQADKGKEYGEAALNTLFKHKMLVIDEKEKHFFLVQEFERLLQTTIKNKARDDGADATRYCIMGIPWDWSVIKGEKPKVVQEKLPTDLEVRRQFVIGNENEKEWNEIFDEEIEEWNEYQEI